MFYNSIGLCEKLEFTELSPTISESEIDMFTKIKEIRNSSIM